MKAFVLLALFAVAAAAAEPIEIPVVDLPYNSQNGLRAPSMQQSLALTASVYELTHAAFGKAFGDREWATRTAVAIFDIASTVELPLPLTDVWIHEEWHRAVLGHRGINSFDDVYLFRHTDSVAVSHVRDEDLIRLKRDHPADQVRLQEAGIEGEHALVQRLEKDHFFRGSRAWHLPLYWLVKLGAWEYVDSATSRDAITETDKWNAEDGSNVKRRDFTGHDFVGWMYDLSRPDEPYQARGVHPSGVGIDRYRKPTDLTPEERSFLRRQGRLQLLNFLDSNLIDVDSFRMRGGTFNVTVAHLLTSFGYSINASLFVRGSRNYFVVLHDYGNRQRHFPGVEAQVIDQVVSFRGAAITVSPRIALWMQPSDQRFRDRSASPGGLIALRVDRGRLFAEAEAKTKGWVSGVESLEKSVALRAGVTFRR